MLHKVLLFTFSLSTFVGGIRAEPAGQVRTRPSDFQSFDSPVGFSIAYPKSGWSVHFAAGGSVLFTQNKAEASVVVDIMDLKEPLVPQDLNETFVSFETEKIRNGSPQAGTIDSARRDIAGNQGMVFNYTRTGPRGQELVRQYSIPIGRRLYRVICSASPANFKGKYEPVFEYMATSLKTAGSKISPGK